MLTWASPNPRRTGTRSGRLWPARRKLPRVWPETYDIHISCSSKGHHHHRRPPSPLVSLHSNPRTMASSGLLNVKHQVCILPTRNCEGAHEHTPGVAHLLRGVPRPPRQCRHSYDLRARHTLVRNSLWSGCLLLQTSDLSLSRSSLVLGTRVPVPSFFPDVHAVINNYLAFDFNWPTLWAIITLAYYYLLEPTAAVRAIPCVLSSSLLT